MYAVNPRNMYDETSISLVMHCWLYMSSNYEYRQSALFAVHALFQNPRSVPSGAKELAVKTVTIDHFIERFVGTLREGTILDGPLEEELWAFFQFVITENPYALAFVNAEVYCDIAGALQYQMHHGTEKLAYDIFSLSHQII